MNTWKVMRAFDQTQRDNHNLVGSDIISRIHHLFPVFIEKYVDFVIKFNLVLAVVFIPR